MEPQATTTNTNKNYRYNLRELEDKCTEAYEKFKVEANEQTRTEVFVTVRDLAHAILCVGNYSKHGIDYEQAAYEYSLYLFGRIVIGTFVPTPKTKKKDIEEVRFPWQNYISINMRHVLTSKREDIVWQDLITDLEYLIERDDPFFNMIDDNSPSPEESAAARLSMNYLANKLYKSLALFYSKEEIQRLTPISVELFYNYGNYLIRPEYPEDIKDYMTVLVSMSKMLVRDFEIKHSGSDKSDHEIREAFTTAIRSSVFLSAVMNTDIFSKKLFLSLDIDSLYRLVSIAGGETINIPTQKDLDSLVGAVVTASEMIMEGKDIEKALVESKVNLGLLFGKRVNVRNLISKIIECNNIFSGEHKATPLLNMLANSITTLDKTLDTICDEKDQVLAVKQYTELSDIFNKFTTNVLSIAEKLEKQNNAKINNGV